MSSVTSGQASSSVYLRAKLGYIAIPSASGLLPLLFFSPPGKTTTSSSTTTTTTTTPSCYYTTLLLLVQVVVGIGKATS